MDCRYVGAVTSPSPSLCPGLPDDVSVLETSYYSLQPSGRVLNFLQTRNVISDPVVFWQFIRHSIRVLTDVLLFSQLINLYLRIFTICIYMHDVLINNLFSYI